ncbi:hypothetical protein V6000_003680 [Aspergillus fumigatus]|nr:hypothetical protein Y699_01367 [Aspergillus fumigatus Z5]
MNLHILVSLDVDTGHGLQELVHNSDELDQEEVLKVERKYTKALRIKDKEIETLKQQIEEREGRIGTMMGMIANDCMP